MSTNILTFTKISQTLLGLAVVAAGMTVLFYFYQHFYVQPPVISQTEIPDLIITEPLVIKTDDSGRKIIHFSSSILWHYQKDNRATFTDPVGYYYPQNSPAWQITADKGDALNGDSIVHLNGNVRLHQDAGQRNHETTLTTSTMTIYPQLSTAETSDSIKIEQPGLTVTSVGFFANFKENKLKLLSKTKGFYNPTTGSQQ